MSPAEVNNLLDAIAKVLLRCVVMGILVEMGPGDYVTIPAHKRHRVEWTTPEEPTVWLAVHQRPVGSLPRKDQ